MAPSKKSPLATLVSTLINIYTCVLNSHYPRLMPHFPQPPRVTKHLRPGCRSPERLSLRKSPPGEHRQDHRGTFRIRPLSHIKGFVPNLRRDGTPISLRHSRFPAVGSGLHRAGQTRKSHSPHTTPTMAQNVSADHPPDRLRHGIRRGEHDRDRRDRDALRDPR